MPKYLKQSSGLPKRQKLSRNDPKQNNTASGQQNQPSLAKMRKRVAMQASLALLTIVLTVIIIFAMSAAWYTNIVQTNGLVFQVKEWGFDGKIVTNTDPILAGPGDDGLIALTVESQSDDICSVSVAVTKTKMDTEIQKRIYFYVDANVERNGESLERIYLNSRDSYTYTLFSQGTLTLTDTYHNDNQIKWQWVYDVLGYYVLGSKTSAGDVIISEYLRPIEYDYDAATMEYVTETDEKGNEILTMEMKTVDGTMTLEEFLVELSGTDGYEGKIDPEEMLESGYYPVDVDENGNGVYAYLCSYAEIELATVYDTYLGQAAADAAANGQAVQTYEATLTVSAQKNKNSVINVTSLAGLYTAMTSSTADVIQLSEDITIGSDEALVVAEGQRVMLDLNGYDITYSAGNSEEDGEASGSGQIPIVVEPGGSLTMINGTVTNSNSEATYAFRSVGGELTLSNVTLTGFPSALKIVDDDDTNEGAADSIVRIVGSTITTTSHGIAIYGNGSDSAQPTQLIIDNSKIVSDGFAIFGNGTISNGGRYGTDIQILNSEISSIEETEWAAIYQPQPDSNLTIYNSKISGYTGIAIKGGSVCIIKSTIQGLGATATEAVFAASGFTDTADAVYIEANYNYDIRLEISEDSVLTSKAGYALQVYEPDAKNVKVKIYSGTFNRLPDADLFKSYVDSGSEYSMTEDTSNGTATDCTVTVPEQETETTTETTTAQ